jgi:hypothetical protein
MRRDEGGVTLRKDTARRFIFPCCCFQLPLTRAPERCWRKHIQRQLTLRGNRPPRPGTVPDLQAKLTLGLVWNDGAFALPSGRASAAAQKELFSSSAFMTAFSDGTGEFGYASRSE